MPRTVDDSDDDSEETTVPLDDDYGGFIQPWPDGSETFEEALENERNRAITEANMNDDDD